MTSMTLYQIEDELRAWANTFELAETEEDRMQIAERVSAYLQAARDKRDRFVEFLHHLDSQAELAKREAARLSERRKSIERLRDMLEKYAIQTLEALGERKLEGNTSTIGLRRLPPSVLITDESAVPLQFKRCTLTLPAEQAADVMLQFDVDPRSVAYVTSKSEIAAAIKAGESVPGADLAIGGNSLVVK